MYGLRAESQRCPDGVVLDADNMFRPRTSARHKILLETVSLRAPYVLAFVNATDDRKLAKFLGLYGCLEPGANECPAWALTEQQSAMTHLLELAGSEDPRKIAEAINKKNRMGGPSKKIMPGGWGDWFTMEHDRQMVFFKHESLAALMRGEIQFVADRGVRFDRCGQCGVGILTGPTTGRKGHAQYCSGRCRAAAHKARHAEK